MIDITDKINTLRTAKAKAVLKVSDVSIKAIKNNSVPKGDVFASARTAGLLAAKNTSLTLPHCHPIPVEFTEINFLIKKSNVIEINIEVKTIYKTGCEMEALYGVSVCALTVYDMLKPIDKNIIIGEISLTSKSGGKSDTLISSAANLKASVIVVSDSVFSGKSKDTSGKIISDKLKSYGIKVKNNLTVPDEEKLLTDKIKKEIKNGADMIITTGGTGASARDITGETVRKIIDKDLSGLMEAARIFGQNKTPYSMMSDGASGFSGKTLILTFPGSPSGVKDYLNALLPYVFHLFDVRKGERH